LAGLLADQGRNEEARREYDTVFALKRKLVTEHPDKADYRRSLANSLYRFGKLLDSKQETQKAEAAFREAIRLQEVLVTEHQHLVYFRFELIRTVKDLWQLLRRDVRGNEATAQFAQAVAIYKPVIDHREAQVRLYPDERKNHVWLIASHEWFGGLLRDAGKNDDAIDSFRHANSARMRLAAQFSKPESDDIGRVINHVRIADIYKNTNRFNEAAREYMKAAELLKTSFSQQPVPATATEGCKNTIATLKDSFEHREPDSFDLFSLAMLHQQLGHTDDAKKAFDEAVQWLESKRPNDKDLTQLRVIAAELIGSDKPQQSTDTKFLDDRSPETLD
jgi:tetratricopeptide (TPR) repeat protein